MQNLPTSTRHIIKNRDRTQSTITIKFHYLIIREALLVRKGHFSTLSQPFYNPFTTLFQPFFNPFSTLFHPFSTILQPFFTLSQPFYNPFTTRPFCNPFTILSQPFYNPFSAIFKQKISFSSKKFAKHKFSQIVK